MLAHPVELSKTAWGNNIDIMIGATSFETGRVLAPLMMDTTFGTAFMDLPTWVPYPLNKTDEEKIIFGEKLREIYYGQVTPTPLMYEQMIEVNFSVKFLKTKLIIFLKGSERFFKLAYNRSSCSSKTSRESLCKKLGL